MVRGCVEYKETLCWGCSNYARCSWADGIPVKGWTATPTIVHDQYGDYGSYKVEKCPQFAADKKVEAKIQDIAALLGVSCTGVYRVLRKKNGVLRLRVMLREKGYKLYIGKVPLRNGKEKREYCIEPL